MEQTINMSVIIPVYNTEKYLRQCVGSLTKQDMNMEIIIVDDGSTDGSGLVADELALNIPLTGKQCFVELTKSFVYMTMICCNIYRRAINHAP